MSERVECVLRAADGVGESPVWSAEDRALLWVDITGRRVHRLEVETGRHDAFAMPDMPTSVGLRAGGGAILGLTKTVHLWDLDRLAPFAEVEPDRPSTRLNEGRVAPDGSFWVGTMENNLDPDGTERALGEPAGRLHRIDPTGAVTPLTPDLFGITNTMIWRDGRFLTADTTANRLYAYDVAPSGRALGGRRPLGEPVERGLPDGSCLDAEGFVWNARFGGGCLVRLAPDGSIDRVLELPCTNPTACVFGGAELGTLYVTSARFALPPGRVAEAPEEGGLFACEVDVRGTPEPLFAG